MKRSVLAGLFMCAAMLTSAVSAAETTSTTDNLCALNLEKINSYLSSLPTTSENTESNLKAARDKATAEQAAGNDEECIATTTQEIQRIQNINKGGK